MKKQKQPFNYFILPIYFIDYLFVMFLYITISIILGVWINGFIIQKYAIVDLHTISTWKLFLLLVTQLFLQGFIVICVIYLLKDIPSPVEGVFNYDSSKSVGTVLRNPAIISILLFTMAVNLKGQLVELYDRITNVAQRILDVKSTIVPKK